MPYLSFQLTLFCFLLRLFREGLDAFADHAFANTGLEARFPKDNAVDALQEDDAGGDLFNSAHDFRNRLFTHLLHSMDQVGLLVP